MKTQQEIDAILAERRQRDAKIFYIDPERVTDAAAADDGIAIFRRKKLFGLFRAGTEVLPCIYDAIEPLGDAFYLISVQGQQALYDLTAGRFITGYDVAAVSRSAGSLRLTGADGKCGLLDTYSRAMIVPPVYDEVGDLNYSSPYVWVRRGDSFHYVRVADGCLLSMPMLVMAFDGGDGLYGMRSDGTVALFSEQGTSLLMEYRRRCIAAGGRIRLQNFVRRLEVVADVYGNIIN